MTPQERLLAAIKARLQKNTEFNGGILTADLYLKTLESCVGSDLCYKFCAKGSQSFHDQMIKAASTLTYNNPDMIVEDLYADWKKGFSAKAVNGDEIELPKNTLMVFKHTLTSPRKDRDNDVLRTEGARPDPNMLMIWQHQHALPIGKMLGIHEHTKQKLVPISALVDINDLAHDSAVMIENKMGRFSHGFKALDFEEVKGDDGRPHPNGGFDIKSFEIMEESLVSVPSNVDANVEEVILSLVSNGKMTSPLMKGYGATIKSKRPLSLNIPGGFPLNLDLKLTVNGKPINQEEQEEDHGDAHDTEKSTGTKCSCQGKPKSTSEETDADDGKEKSTDVKEVKCPKCGEQMKDGKCSCGYTEKNDEPETTKAGRVLNSKNYTKLMNARDNLAGLADNEPLMSRGGKAMCREAHNHIEEVIKSAGVVEERDTVELSVKEAMTVFIAKATPTDLKKMQEAITTLGEINKRAQRGERFKGFFKGKK